MRLYIDCKRQYCLWGGERYGLSSHPLPPPRHVDNVALGARSIHMSGTCKEGRGPLLLEFIPSNPRHSPTTTHLFTLYALNTNSQHWAWSERHRRRPVRHLGSPSP